MIPAFLRSSAARREACALALLVAVALASRLPFVMHGLDEWDSANFAMAVVRFDVLNHQPHPPGQYVYVRLMQLLNTLTGNELFTLSLASAVAGSFALVPYYLTLRQIFRCRIALGAAVLTAFTFGYWTTGLRMISDPVAALFVYAVVAAWLAGLRSRGWFLLGMGLCGVTLGVKQTAVYFLAPLGVAVNLAVLRRTGPKDPLMGAAIFLLAVAAWLLPTVARCQSWARYLAACRALQQENYATESLVFHFTPDAAVIQWRHNFLEPWGAPALAAGMLTLAVVGLAFSLRQRTSGRFFALFGLTVVLYAFLFLYRFNKYYVYYVPVYAAFAAAALFALGEILARRLRRPALGLGLPLFIVLVITVINVRLAAPLLPKISHFRAPAQAALEMLFKLPGVGPKPVLLTDDRTTGHALRYFHLKQKVDLLNSDADLSDAIPVLGAGRSIYFLTPATFDFPPTPGCPVRGLGRFTWRPELYDVLQGRPDQRQLSLYAFRDPLPGEYRFTTQGLQPPLLQRGMWEDGWCGADSTLLLPFNGPGRDLAYLRFTAPANFDYAYPYRLTCLVGGIGQPDLIFDHPGEADFVVPLSALSGTHAVELRLLAPKTVRPAQLEPRQGDQRELSVHLEELVCVTKANPLFTRRLDGWYDQESDGRSQWRWTNRRASLFVAAYRAGNLVMKMTAASCTANNVLELSVDGQPVATLPMPGTNPQAMTWRLPMAEGVHRVTLASENASVQVPGDSRFLAFQMYDLQFRLEP